METMGRKAEETKVFLKSQTDDCDGVLRLFDMIFAFVKAEEDNLQNLRYVSPVTDYSQTVGNGGTQSHGG